MKQRFSLTSLIFLLSFGLIGSASLWAQGSTANGVPVQTVVTVEPHHGSNPPVISREDVMVFEGKDRDVVTDWVPAQGDHAALEFFILLDDGSDTSLGTQLQYLHQFINGQAATTKIGVAYMQNGIARIEQNLTSDRDLAEKAIRLPLGYYGANASPYFSLSDLAKRWQQNGARHEVLMITNGFDPYYGIGDTLDPYLSAAIEDSQRAGILVSAIFAPSEGHVGHSYWINYWGQLYLAQLAEETGGEGYYIGFVGAAPDFTPYLKDMANRFTHQYLLTFRAKPQKKAGMQAVKIKTELHNVDLVSASHVYVPASE